MPVVDVDVTSSEIYQLDKHFPETVDYQRLDGVLTFAVDPRNLANLSIVDLALAPRDPDGLVRFESDFRLLVPRNPALGNQRLIVDIVNRGRPLAVNNFNMVSMPTEGEHEISLGDGFLFRHGYSIVSIGWQWDVYRSEALLGLESPIASKPAGDITGQIIVEIRPNVREQTRLLADRTHKPYQVADLDDPEAVLFVRDWEDGPDNIVSRSNWCFARESDNRVSPSSEHIYLDTGFEPGKIYHVVYTTNTVPVVGAGLLAVRDVATWLRTPSILNPVVKGFQKVYGFGISQTGRLLRQFVYLGLNQDENGEQVYDGLMPHVAGGRVGQFNHRFAQPSNQSMAGFGHVFPFSDDDILDPFSRNIDGLLTRQRSLGAVPKIIYTNSSAEYWRGDGSLLHIEPSGEKDIDLESESRIYHFAGTQHGPGLLPQTTDNIPNGPKVRYLSNTVDYRPLLRAVLVNLDLWVSRGVVPPLSRYPRLDDGTAIRREEALFSIADALGVLTPDPCRLWVLREMDIGPEVRSGVGRYPVLEGRKYPCFVSALDVDGNEISGVRLPDITVPVGTHTGWNLRSPEAGASDQIVPMQGFTNFFPATQNNNISSFDNRSPIDQRYEGRAEYLKLVLSEIHKLVQKRYLLEEDILIVIDACKDRYDLAVQSTPSTIKKSQ